MLTLCLELETFHAMIRLEEVIDLPLYQLEGTTVKFRVDNLYENNIISLLILLKKIYSIN